MRIVLWISGEIHTRKMMMPTAQQATFVKKMMKCFFLSASEILSEDSICFSLTGLPVKSSSFAKED